VHGFDPEGADQTGIYGSQATEPLLDQLAGLIGFPTSSQPAGILQPNVITATRYYGNAPPPYYQAQDIADLDAVTAQWGSGVPRHALIVAK
jgi:hypothetical protein